MRGEPRQLGEIKTLTISHKYGRWYASIVIAYMPAREHGTARIGFAWGIERFLTFDDGTGVDNPRFLRKSERKLEALGGAVSRKSGAPGKARLFRLTDSRGKITGCSGQRPAVVN
ncbi:MAG: hypothetical protein HYV63_17900 [Candidatus Schekmanbacteria bacterium]|nr:hypothetical protein [Candidatus Schekmanbacteria bacterium]